MLLWKARVCQHPDPHDERRTQPSSPTRPATTSLPNHGGGPTHQPSPSRNSGDPLLHHITSRTSAHPCRFAVGATWRRVRILVWWRRTSGVFVSITTSQSGDIVDRSGARRPPVRILFKLNVAPASAPCRCVRGRFERGALGPDPRSRLASMSALRRRRSGVLSAGGELVRGSRFPATRWPARRSDRASTIRAGHDREVDRCLVRCR